MGSKKEFVRALSTHFWFTAVAPDCQDLLKHEIATRHAHLRLAFSRPGLVTFKSEHPLTLLQQPESHLALLSGVAIGGGKTLEEVIARISGFFEAAREPNSASKKERESAGEVPLRAFAWPTAEDEECTSAAELRRVEEAARRALAVDLGERGADGELGLLVPPPGRESWGYFAFARRATPRALPEKVTPPPEAPSRAYSKLVEAMAHFGLAPRAGEVALELGAAPGGATYALLERGLSVLAVDPAAMDARLAPFADERGLTLRHLKKPAQALHGADLSELPAPASWLISDMNVSPPISAQHVLRARSLIKKDLRGAILTLKLNDAAAVDTLPRVLGELERAFGAPPQVAHLPSHRREIVAVFRS